MRDSLKRADIDQAKQQLQRRRAEMLQRHAEELGRFDTDQSELEALTRLAIAFAERYQKPAATPATEAAPVAEEAAADPPRPAEEPAPSPPPERPEAPEPPLVAKISNSTHAVHRPAHERRRDDPRDYGRTNFETFSRAVAKSTF